MNVTDLEEIASRLRTIVRDGWEFGQNRNTLLALVEEFANDLQDEADTIAKAMAENAGPYETDLWYDTSRELI